MTDFMAARHGGDRDAGRRDPAVPADLVFVGGRVVTTDPANRLAEGVSVRGSRIMAVGSVSDVMGSAGETTEIVDLSGRSLVPGLIDNHIHMTNAFQRHWVDCSYPHCRSIADVVEVMASAAARRPVGSWVIGRGFEPARLAEGRSPTRHDLDRAIPDHLVGVCNREGMGWTFNTRGLRAVGVRDDTPDPPGGSLERDNLGAPLGAMWDNARSVFVVPNIPRPTDHDIVESYAWIEHRLLSLGVTTAHEAGYREPRQARVWAMLRRRQEPGIRVVLGPYPLYGATWDEDSAPGCLFRSGLTTGFGDDWLRIGALQMGVDGGLIGRTAALFEPYSDRSGYRGSFRVTFDTLAGAVRRADEAGWQTGLICQGDSGIDLSLRAIQQLGDGRAMRHRLEHAYVWTPELMDLMASLGVVWNTQPALLPVTGPHLRTMLGPRARWAFPFRSMIERGIIVSGGSDWGVGPMNPFIGIDAMVNHRSDLAPDSPPFNPAEAISVLEALRVYTMGGALAGREEREKGSIEVGKLADLVVIDRDITRVSGNEIGSVRVARTYVGGRLVYDRDREDDWTVD